MYDDLSTQQLVILVALRFLQCVILLSMLIVLAS